MTTGAYECRWINNGVGDILSPVELLVQTNDEEIDNETPHLTPLN
jgi:hypothetical protein